MQRSAHPSISLAVLCLFATGLLSGCNFAFRERPSFTAAPGSAGLGDPLYPGLGNGGYDVSHYTVRATPGSKPGPPSTSPRSISTSAASRSPGLP